MLGSFPLWLSWRSLIEDSCHPLRVIRFVEFFDFHIDIDHLPILPQLPGLHYSKSMDRKSSNERRVLTALVVFRSLRAIGAAVGWATEYLAFTSGRPPECLQTEPWWECWWTASSQTLRLRWQDGTYPESAPLRTDSSILAWYQKNAPDHCLDNQLGHPIPGPFLCTLQMYKPTESVSKAAVPSPNSLKIVLRAVRGGTQHQWRIQRECCLVSIPTKGRLKAFSQSFQSFLCPTCPTSMVEAVTVFDGARQRL